MINQNRIINILEAIEEQISYETGVLTSPEIANSPDAYEKQKSYIEGIKLVKDIILNTKKYI